MLFESLFKGDKGITIGKRRKRKLTIRDVVDRLNKFDFTTANCTMIRDHLGNEKIEEYGDVDVFRLRDEEVFFHDGTICITTPTGMKLKSEVGNSDLHSMISEVDMSHNVSSSVVSDPFAEAEADDAVEFSTESESDDSESDDGQAQENAALTGVTEADEEAEAEAEKTVVQSGAAGRDAFSEARETTNPQTEEQDNPLGVDQVIRLRFFFNRVPYELDCQIVDRFNPNRIPTEIDLTPRFGVGYRVKPLSDVRNRDQRRYIRYTHKVGFGPLRMRTEIQFQIYAHRTNIEIPEKGVLAPVLTHEDFKTTPFGSQEVPEVKGADRLEDIVEFFMHCMVNNPTERRKVYLGKPYLDRRNRSSLEGLGYYNTVGAQQTTILPKMFIKKQMSGSVLDRMLADKGKGPRDTHKMRVIEDIQDRYSLLTREMKIWQARQRQKRVESYENDTCLLGYSSPYGLSPGDAYTTRPFTMFCELTDSGLENLTLKPIPYDDARSREID
ncbi:MAG: hypothetical protein QGG64_08985, partial [Candidatus Latescibacteria bacterium]|nr:hypothetical protein [Candidatus Latescibacterota bacterium]